MRDTVSILDLLFVTYSNDSVVNSKLIRDAHTLVPAAKLESIQSIFCMIYRQTELIPNISIGHGLRTSFQHCIVK